MGIAISAHVNLAITLRQAAPIRLLLTNVKASFSLGTLKKRVKRMKERYNLSQVQDQSEGHALRAAHLQREPSSLSSRSR
jgi:hypothetical protein